MPSITGEDSWGNLVNATYGLVNDVYGASRINNWPLNYTPTGNYYGNYGRITNGEWWSISSSLSANSAYFVYNHGTNISPQSGTSRGYGNAIRCVVCER